MAVSPHLMIRADGGPVIGAGHLGRCLALAQAWVAAHGSATLCSIDPPRQWADRFAREGIRVVDADGVGDGGPEADWAVLDGYGFGAADAERLGCATERLLVLTDHGFGPDVDAGVVLDQNVGAAAGSHRDRWPAARLLLGTRYALLRWEVARARPRPVPALSDEQPVRRLLVSVGGGGHAAGRRVTERVLAHPRVGGLDIDTLAGVEDVAPVMVAADLALAAGGTTVWELCHLGVPAVLFPVAANQVPTVERLVSAGVVAGVAKADADPDEVRREVLAMLDDPARRRQCARRGRDLVDGRGAVRVVSVLRAGLLDLRPVTAADARRLWEWVNDPVTRAASFSPDPIAWDDHERWLAGRLADPATHHWVAATRDGRLVGQIRFDVAGGEAEVDASIAPERRGEGWASALVRAGADKLQATAAPAPVRPLRVVARGRPDNVASARTFERAGFALVHEADAARPWRRYTLDLPRDGR